MWAIPQLKKLLSQTTLGCVMLTVKADEDIIVAICACILLHVSGEAQYREESPLQHARYKRPCGKWPCTSQGHLTEVLESHGSQSCPHSLVWHILQGHPPSSPVLWFPLEEQLILLRGRGSDNFQRSLWGIDPFCL